MYAIRSYYEFKPEFSLSESTFKAGMWVRDSSAGIGTITFYDPQTQMFGGLGHPVCDSDTGEIIPLHSGEVVPVTINGVTKGIAGTPGELIGSFVITSYSIHYTKLYEIECDDTFKTSIMKPPTFVITSYSIHYTKLYEKRGELRNENYVPKNPQFNIKKI